MRHFVKIAEGIDVVPLLNELASNDDLWNENGLRTTYPGTPHSETDDIWVWFNRIPTNPAEVVNDVDVIPYRAWRDLPSIRAIVLGLMHRVGGVRVGRVIISRLAPGKTIAAHVDQGAPADFYTRYHLALQSYPGALNYSGEEVISYAMGEFWRFDNRAPHSIINNSADDRIVVVMDFQLC